jgi:hypothetical protein
MIDPARRVGHGVGVSINLFSDASLAIVMVRVAVE